MVMMNFIGGTFRGLNPHTKKVCSLQWRLLSQLTVIVKLKEILPYIHLYYSASAKILHSSIVTFISLFCSAVATMFVLSFILFVLLSMISANTSEVSQQYISIYFNDILKLRFDEYRVFSLVLIVRSSLMETTTDWGLLSDLLGCETHQWGCDGRWIPLTANETSVEKIEIVILWWSHISLFHTHFNIGALLYECETIINSMFATFPVNFHFRLLVFVYTPLKWNSCAMWTPFWNIAA